MPQMARVGEGLGLADWWAEVGAKTPKKRARVCALMKCGIDPSKTDFIHHSWSLSITAGKVFQSCLFKGNTKRGREVQ